MALEERVELTSAQTAADLSAASNLFKVVKLDSAGAVVAVAATTDIPFGIQYDTGKSGATIPVAVGGLAKAKAGATIAAGVAVATKADGTLQTAVATQYVIGTARWGAVSGDIMSVELSLPGSIKA